MKRRLLPVLLLLLFASGCASSPQDGYTQDAQRLLSEGRAAEAARLTAAAASHEPGSATLAYNHLYALYQGEEYELAATGAADAFARFPAHLELLRLRARALTKAGLEQEAEAAWLQLFALDPGDQALMARVMEDAFQHDQHSLAERLALKLLASRTWEQQALSILSALHPDRWYEAALSYITDRD
ncbi:MAG: hypothetical protein M0Q37_06445 [Sphaerochaeta sp.]|nr:hypothetical protein [Sphaerochaeta sp.]